MARDIDLSKPLSKADRDYLLARHTVSYVDRMVELAGGQAEEAPQEPEDTGNGGSGTEGTEGSETGGEDLIGAVGDFDPGTHTVDEVVAHLKDAPEEEKARVLALEADGKGRTTILNS